MSMEFNSLSLPPVLTLFPGLKPPNKTLLFHQTCVLVITFLAYASFHASRKPPSIVKSVLGPTVPLNSTQAPNLSPTDAGWPPFNDAHGTHRLGELDLAFLSSYSVGMYFAGHVGDRIDLRLFLVVGMMGSGIFTVLFGLGYWFDVHVFGYFVVVQIFCGVFQSIGWPCVVAVVGNWLGESKRGFIMGVWSSHTSVGNIVGSFVASGVLEFGWGWSFVVPGLLIIFVGILVYVFLVVSPEDMGFVRPGIEVEMSAQETSAVKNPQGTESEEAMLIQSEDAASSDSSSAIGFLEAWKIPGVASFAFCLFFSKLVAYTFLYWLPFYIRHTAVAGMHISHKTSGLLSTIFDIGGVLGGITAGFISDVIEARAITSILFLFLSIPALILYRAFGSLSMLANIALMFTSGFFVNGPYSLITTAVAADLGMQSSNGGNSRAVATVTAIIDGTGSVGAALGPLLAGYISTRGWNSVFLMLILSILFAGLFLIRVARTEISAKLPEK
ncbi:putative glycerol-3-phosphate transporter 5 [Arachis stenosperma]|uniref:putative glycerol-3-phosphate transporter 5 n=1 Tax=Arachis stenosperma TaxID=217475 RepID=UPI0025AD7638|nr:putative glycerol-3-phosphate transporter 5 [Arachis stenosperma]XP_057751379.1 putative glycerol-3-phosphate transporter 5 [Arachis stenosperma]